MQSGIKINHKQHYNNNNNKFKYFLNHLTQFQTVMEYYYGGDDDTGYSSDEYDSPGLDYSINNNYDDNNNEPICQICGIYCPGDTPDICMIYEQTQEYTGWLYHHYKKTGSWSVVKRIVQASMKNTQNDIFLIDILEQYLENNNINFFLITAVEYKYQEKIYHIPKYESQFLMEHLKINSNMQPSISFEYDNYSRTYRLQIV